MNINLNEELVWFRDGKKRTLIDKLSLFLSVMQLSCIDYG